MPDALIVGCGYVGERLARVLPGDVRCLTRSVPSAARLSGMGFDAVACDFPELKLCGIHVGIPWHDEMIAMAW
ncbi:MAG: hypothetical protein ACO3IZ_08695, partial [Steroidobacteraceae bacterium]